MDEAASQLLVLEKWRDLTQLSRGSGQGRESTADFAKVRADFWQADVRSGVSQESVYLVLYSPSPGPHLPVRQLPPEISQ